jgi:hypothetical protein
MDLFTNRSDAVIRGAVEFRQAVVNGQGAGTIRPRNRGRGRGGGGGGYPTYGVRTPYTANQAALPEQYERNAYGEAALPEQRNTPHAAAGGARIPNMTNQAGPPPQQAYTRAQMESIIQSVEANNKQYTPSSVLNRKQYYSNPSDSVYKLNEPPGTGVFGMAGNSIDAEADRSIFANMNAMERAGMVNRPVISATHVLETESTANPEVWGAIRENIEGQYAYMEEARQNGTDAGQAMDDLNERAIRNQLSQYGDQVVRFYDQRQQSRSDSVGQQPNDMTTTAIHRSSEPGPSGRVNGTPEIRGSNNIGHQQGVGSSNNNNNANDDALNAENDCENSRPGTGLQRLDPDNPWFRHVNIGGVQRLGSVLDEINMEQLWNSGVFRTTLGSFTAQIVRLFITAYERVEERTAVEMIREAMFRGALVANDPRHNSSTDYWELYRMRAGFLIGWATFRRLIERMELKEYITRKHKTDLTMLYILLSSSDVRLYRDTNDKDAVSFFDPITGYGLRTPPLLNRPLTIDMRVQNMFGNISKSTKLLDRSINTACNNMKRKREPVSADEIVALLDMSVPLAIDEPPDPDSSGNPPTTTTTTTTMVDAETEQTILRDMLANTMIVSMMAEEFRVFVGDMQTNAVSAASAVKTRQKPVPRGNGKSTATPLSGLTIGSGGSSNLHEKISETDTGGNNAATFELDRIEGLPKSARHRKPVFYTFTKSSKIQAKK